MFVAVIVRSAADHLVHDDDVVAHANLLAQITVGSDAADLGLLATSMYARLSRCGRSIGRSLYQVFLGCRWVSITVVPHVRCRPRGMLSGAATVTNVICRVIQNRIWIVYMAYQLHE